MWKIWTVDQLSMKKVHAKKLFKKIPNCGSALTEKMWLRNEENIKNMNCGSAFDEKSACKVVILKNSQLWISS